MPVHGRLGCSTITFRRLPLREALTVIHRLGFAEIDLGALPGVCDHVPYVLDRSAVADVAHEVLSSGLTVRSVNGDIGDLNQLLDPADRRTRRAHLDRLLELTVAIDARALVLPNGALSHEPLQDLTTDIARVADELRYAAGRAAEHGVELWVESLHLFRLCHNLERAQLLTDALAGAEVGIVLDISHVVACGAEPAEFISRFGRQVRHVHLRDATPGNINLSIGNGTADFPGALDALSAAGYAGHFTLELETRDVTDAERPRAAGVAGHYISELLGRAGVTASPARSLDVTTATSTF
jgi:sugar phosphate isomerase/epimerase